MKYTANQLEWIIDPRNLSFQRIKVDLISFVESRPDYERWKDFLESSTGTTLLELIAGLGTYNSFHATHIRREAYIHTLWLYTSAINLAATLGYPVNRLIAPKLEITIESSVAAYWDREYPIAYYGDKPVSLYVSSNIQQGTNKFTAFIGEWSTYSTVITETKSFNRVLMVAPNVDNNSEHETYPTIEVYVNGVLLDLYKSADELTPTSCLEVTHQDGLIFAFGDNFLGQQLRKNDTLTIKYVTAADSLDTLYVYPENFVSNFVEGSVTATTLIHPGYHKDEIQKISHVAPAYFSAKKRMVTGADHDSILLSYSGPLISASHRKVDGECCTIEMCYLFDDEHIITDTEEKNILAYLDKFKMVGEKIVLVDPEKIGLDIRMIIVVDEGFTNTEMRDWVISCVDSVTMQLGKTFHIGEVTRLVAEYPGVYRVYLERPINDRELYFNEYIKLQHLDIIVTSDKKTVVSIDPSNNGYLS